MLTPTARFLKSIRAFHDKTLSAQALLGELDQLLTSTDTTPALLLNMLEREQAQQPLPADLLAQVQQRIAQFTEFTQSAEGEATLLQSHPDQRSPAPGPVPADAADTERIKGVGDTLNGRFVLEECIGFGGMGTVYRALDLRKIEASDRKPYIAIKVLNVPFRAHPKSLIALQREARKAQALAHPNIITVYDFDRDGAMVYLTMEYLAGKPLSQVLRAPGFSGMPLEEALRIVGGMGDALAYAHERGFVHSDFKPANVFLTDKGGLKVIDFGIARVFRKSEDEEDATVFDAGSLGGLTPAYASPEMLEQRDPDPRDDIYALACITYELLTGRHPFDRLPSTQARNTRMQPQRPPGLTARQWRGLKAALSFERAARTPTVPQFLHDLRGTRRRSRVGGWAVAVLGAMLMLAAGWHFGWRGRGVDEVGPGQAMQTGAIKVTPPADTAPLLSVAAIMPVLAQVPCAALAPTIRDQTVQVHGYAPARVDASGLKEKLSAIPGVRQVELAIRPIADKECDLIETFAPYWINNHLAGTPASIRARAADGQLHEGDPLVVDITTPAFESVVHVDYFSLDGQVGHLVPNARNRDNQAPANYAATIGSLGNWVVAKPFGTEMIVLVTTPAPLFDEVRPDVEPRAAYLQALRQQLRQQASRYGNGRVMVDFVQITTSARRP